MFLYPRIPGPAWYALRQFGFSPQMQCRTLQFWASHWGAKLGLTGAVALLCR